VGIDVQNVALGESLYLIMFLAWNQNLNFVPI
ncbi:uncharacterized protein METZ01_LOCUS298560, partial [marine metagenome]